MKKTIDYYPNFISEEEAANFLKFYEKLDDKLLDGPRKHIGLIAGKTGGYNRITHYQTPYSKGKYFPIDAVMDKIIDKFGDFIIGGITIKNMHWPLGVHTDAGTLIQYLKTTKLKVRPLRTFMIPLWWDCTFPVKTYFFSTPAEYNEPSFNDYAEDLPKYIKQEDGDIQQFQSVDFSVKKILEWKNPGDLLTWENYQHHCSNDANRDKQDGNCFKKYLVIWTVKEYT
jgi:hypothetical protein